MMGDNMSKLIKKIYIWDIISLVFKVLRGLLWS